MDEKICPNCKRENLPDAERCWYCQTSLSSNESAASQPSESEEDWLASLRGETSNEAAEEIPGDSSAQEDPPVSAEPPQPEEEIPDWLMRIRMREQAEREAMKKPEEEPVSSDASWLEELRNKQTGEEPEEEQGQAEQPEIPGWISELSSKTPEEESTNISAEAAEPAAAEEPDSEWLKKLTSWQAESSTEKKEETPPAEEPSAPVPSGAAPVSPESEESMPDWLRSFLGEPASEATEAGGEPQEKPGIQAEPEIHAEREEVEPSFGSMLEKAMEEPSEETIKEEPPAGEETPQVEPEISAAAFPADEGYDFSSEEKQPAAEAEKPEDIIPPLEELEQPGLEVPISEEEEKHEAAVPSPEEIAAPVSASEADLDWLRDYHEAPEEEGIEKAGKAESAASGVGVVKPISRTEKPGTGVPVRAQAAEGGEEASEAIEMAKLPPWLQKLRSVDNIQLTPAVESEEKVTETAGPLAGIEGALQSSEVAELYSRPPIYTSKVQVTERQAMRADILRSMVEKQPGRVEKEGTAGKVKFKVGKLLLGLVLILAVVLPMVLQPGVALLPSLYPPETANTFNLINAIPADQPVLLAADFEPGLSGEMSLSSQMLVEHLMLRNLPIAMLSTNPTGSALMETIMDKAQVNAGAYDRGNRVVSLGYLAGGSVGLQTLARDLAGALPYTSDLTPTLSLPVLQNIHSVADFGAVIVITEDADTARYWVEQVQPVLGATPLIVVASAQAAPMLQPYYDSGQISGMISGLSGGTAYEQILQRPGSAVNAYGAYQAAMLILVLIIFVGGAFSIIRNSARTDRA